MTNVEYSLYLIFFNFGVVTLQKFGMTAFLKFPEWQSLGMSVAYPQTQGTNAIILYDTVSLLLLTAKSRSYC